MPMNKRIASLVLVTAMLICMTVFSSVAYADYGNDVIDLSALMPTPEPTATPEPITFPEAAEPITIPETTPEPLAVQPQGGIPFTNDGNMKLIDNLFAADTHKQFLTVETKNGQLFYLIVDYDAVQNEESDSYEVHFLNKVDEADLTALLKELDIKIEEPKPTPTPVPQIEVIQNEDEDSGIGSIAIILVLLLLICGTVVYYIKFIKAKPKTRVPANTDEYDFDDDEYEESEDEE